MYIYILTWFSPRQHFLIPGFVMMHYFFFHQIEILHISSSLPLTLFSPADICSMTFTLYILSKRISWSWSCMDGICIQIGFALLFNIDSMEQARKVSTNIFTETAKFLFMAIHICQRQLLSNFFLKKSMVSKDNSIGFYQVLLA